MISVRILDVKGNLIEARGFSTFADRAAWFRRQAEMGIYFIPDKICYEMEDSE